MAQISALTVVGSSGTMAVTGTPVGVHEDRIVSVYDDGGLIPTTDVEIVEYVFDSESELDLAAVPAGHAVLGVVKVGSSRFAVCVVS